MRLFLAINIPFEKELREVQQQIQFEQLSQVNHFHITLKFFGDVSEQELKTICNRLDNLRFDKINLTTDSALDCFDNWNRCRVIFVPVKNNELSKLSMKINALFSDMFENDKFSGHITIARVKYDLTKEQIDKIRKITITPLAWKAEECILYESTLTSKGPEYKIRKKIKLE